jgi:heterodisulfide reductase subunit B
MRLGYYPGCSLEGSSREFDESTRALLKALKVDLVEVPDWNCCGASSAHALDPQLAIALPLRILALAERAGLEEVLAPCAACSNRLLSAQKHLRDHPESKAEIERAMGLGYEGTVRVVNVLEVLGRLQGEIVAGLRTPFAHRVAAYYGCLLVRPPDVVRFDRPEDPRSMDALVKLVGGVPVEWPFKTECCGAALSLTRTDLVGKLGARLVRDAVQRGAEALVVACPLCHSNLDLRRPAINACLEAPSAIPVLFITQVIGLAMGLEPEALGLHRHLVPVAFAPSGAAAGRA